MSEALTPLQRAFLAMQQAEARAAALEADATAPIAIIGLGCRAPGGVTDAQSFWTLLSEGGDAVRPPPADRWDHDALFDPDPDAPGRIAATAGGFIDAIDQFDADFFGLSPREADLMDPQQRLLLEVCWETLENAGWAPDRLEGSATGVYVGAAGADYAYMQLKAGDAGALGPHFASGIAHSVLSGRVSYLLGLQGPSLSIDTACSSSLVAVHLACQALRAKECRLALAGGVNLILSPDIYIALSRAHMLAPDGRCKAFDAAADGFGRGEGCAMVALKRLSDAEADGDRVLAVIRGSAVNQDGPSSGLTAPNGPAQQAVIQAALSQANLTPRQVGYIEAHGTGTQLGDPLEAQALGAVFAPDRPASDPLLVSSVKANLGHLEAASGAIGLIKTVLSLQHATIPAHPHFKTPSPHIAWKDLALRVPAQATPWPEIEGRRVGGVSSFGFSGTNAHIVVEAAPQTAPRADVRTGWLAPLSAHHPDALRRLAAATRDAIAQDSNPADVERTLTLGRANLEHRAVIRAESVEDLRQGLDALALGVEAVNLAVAHTPRRDPPRIAFLFTGQGAQYAGMAKGLYRSAPAFRDAFDRCDEILTPILGASLRQTVLESDDAKALEQTALAQPALFTIEYALAELLGSLGVKPMVVMGHSVGEYVAACVAGALALDDALRLIAARGALMQSLPAGGAMAAVFAPEARVAAAIAPHAKDLSIAAVNGPAQTVISGAAAAVRAVSEALAAEGVKVHPLQVSHAFHSPLVEPILDAFEKEVAAVAFAAPAVRIISNLTGQTLDAKTLASPRYWRRHLREPVRFADGLAAVAKMDIDIAIEVGPHPALSAFALTVFDGEGAPAVIPTLNRKTDDWQAVLEAVGRLHLSGVEIDWHGLDPQGVGRPTNLPTAPFQRQRHWFETAAPPVQRSAGTGTGHPLLGARLRSPLTDTVQFEAQMTAASAPFLADHVVQGRTIMPAAGMIEMALSAGRRGGDAAVDIEGFVIAEPLGFTDDETRTVQTVVRRSGGQATRFEIVSCDARATEGDWAVHAQGDYVPAAATTAGGGPSTGALNEATSGADHYRGLERRGLTFGASLHGVVSVRAGDAEALGDIELPAEAAGQGGFTIHPALLDACLQVIAAALPQDHDATFLPIGIDAIRLARGPGQSVRAHVKLRDQSAALIRADVVIYEGEQEIGRLDGVSMRPLRADLSSDVYGINWRLADASAAIEWSPAELNADLDGRLIALAAEHDLNSYQRAFLALERQSTAWIVQAFNDLGWRPAAGERFTAGDLAVRLGVAQRFHRLLPRLLAILVEDGILSEDGDSHVVVAWPTGADVGVPVSASAAAQARVAITASCGEVLGDILAGRVDPLHRLFPDGSSAMAETLYRESPEATAYNRMLGEAIARLVSLAPAGRKVRILEVGGGTGGSTSKIVPLLPADRVEYLFTDVGHSLVERARESFSAYGFMTFQTFDLEGDPSAQGLGLETFDIVIGANVVHATADLRRTLGKLRSLLAPGGGLFMLEVTGFERWIDITFGLTDGWWLFSDLELRPDYPLMERGRWVDLLNDIGFEAAELGQELETSREALLIARRAPEKRRWALVGQEGGTAADLAYRLRALGDEAVVMDPAAPLTIDETFDAVVHLGFLDAAASTDAAQPILERQREAFVPLLNAVRLLGAGVGKAPRLWIASQGGAVTGGELAAPDQASALGFRRSAVLEHPEWRPTVVDLDPETPREALAAALLSRLVEAGPEQEIALRGDHAFVSRLARVRSAQATAPVRLEASATGVLDDLRLAPTARRSPAAGEVEIRVAASGLNFRDVMNALAMREDSEPLGGECAGLVTAVGEGVEGFKIGDPVVATASGALATYVLADARCVALRPRGLSDAQAAALPLVTMTARYALHDLAGLSKGQSVLIHAGAGGVGLAAIQIAQAAGATLFATAGSNAKRDLLRGLGVDHVFSSRTLDFEQEIAAVTGGRGVDVVLNSLSGNFITASVNVLAAGGVFLEIGKQDIWTQARFGAVRPNGRYHVIDLSITRLEDPALWGQMFRALMGDVERGVVRPPPVRAFPFERAAEAFTFMAQSRHVGKIVLIDAEVGGQGFADLDPDGVYLVTGGLSGLGLETARRLVERGARRLALVGRRAPGAAAEAAIADWRADGVDVLVRQADVGNRAALAEVLDAIDAAGHPLRGVAHSAGALNDGALVQQDWARFETPLHAKVAGAWALHEFTRERRLDFFILYSSIAGTLGSAGQANHAAANAFMDALAEHRRAIGLPGLSIAWGAWSEIGAAADRGIGAMAASRGIGSIAPKRGLDTLEALVAKAPAQVAVSPMDWPKYLTGLRGAAPAFLADFIGHAIEARPVAARDEGVVRGDAFRRELEEAAPSSRRDMMIDFVGRTVVRVLGRKAEGSLDPRRPLNEMGLDSLLAVELRNRLGAGLGMERGLPATLVFDCPTVEALAAHLERRVMPSAAADEPVQSAAKSQDAIKSIDELSDEEVEALFAQVAGS
jgi:acyl transferase domain-containing protein/NADPH:quinone reductase-like Zn-dependent oxidoreductase/NAD(P)-dependent dehydrogenase (short-subunit alcohol dehydrogenase family)